MSWRPDDSREWIANREHDIKIIVDTCNNEETDHICIFEASADAILEALKALPTSVLLAVIYKKEAE